MTQRFYLVHAWLAGLTPTRPFGFYRSVAGFWFTTTDGFRLRGQLYTVIDCHLTFTHSQQTTTLTGRALACNDTQPLRLTTCRWIYCRAVVPVQTTATVHRQRTRFVNTARLLFTFPAPFNATPAWVWTLRPGAFIHLVPDLQLPRSTGAAGHLPHYGSVAVPRLLFVYSANVP